jgi:hypothetical protein
MCYIDGYPRSLASSAHILDPLVVIVLERPRTLDTSFFCFFIEISAQAAATDLDRLR